MPDCTVEIYRFEGFRGGRHSVTSRDAAWGTAPRVRAAKSSEFGEEKL